MALIKLSEGFRLIPEGTYVFQIVKADYKEDFGKLEITLKTKDGYTHIERFNLLNADGTLNDRALSSFSYFARTALDDNSITEIDHEKLVGHFLEAEVKHTEMPSRTDPTKTVTFVNLGDKRPSSGWVINAPSVAKNIDLKSLLG